MSVQSISAVRRLAIVFVAVLFWQWSCGSLSCSSARLPDGIITGGTRIGIGDALRALRIAVGLIVPADKDLSRGDVSPLVNNMPRMDGKIDVNDALLMLRKVVGLTDWITDPPAGTIDVTFGDGGLAVSTLDNGDSCANVLGIQPDGKLLIVGPYFPMGSTYPSSTVLRLNTNGSPDVNFGHNGNGVIGPYAAAAEALTIQADGKVVFAGLSANGSTFQSVVIRLNSDGTDDISFSGTGRALIPFNDVYYNQALAVALQPDGNIIVSGYVATDSDHSGTRFAIARYNHDGKLDPGFGNGGLIINDFSGNNFNSASDLAIQPDRKIVVAGITVTSPFLMNSILLRYNPDGTPDTGFGIGGVVATDLRFTWNRDTVLTPIIQDDGRILLTGLDSAFPMLFRYTSDGSLDTDFGTGGKVFAQYPGNYFSTVNGVARQADGKLVTAGLSKNGDQDFVMFRHNSDGTLDAGFGAGGIATADLGGVFFSTRTIGIQPDGRLIAAGCLSLPSGKRLAVLRLWP